MRYLITYKNGTKEKTNHGEWLNYTKCGKFICFVVLENSDLGRKSNLGTGDVFRMLNRKEVRSVEVILEGETITENPNTVKEKDKDSPGWVY